MLLPLSNSCFKTDVVLPVFCKVRSILTTIPASTCSAERSLSDLRRIETYLRSTIGQDHFRRLALICIKRAYANRTLESDMENIIDTFGKRKNRIHISFDINLVFCEHILPISIIPILNNV